MSITVMASSRRFFADESGHAAVEYALVLALILGAILYAASSIFSKSAGH